MGGWTFSVVSLFVRQFGSLTVPRVGANVCVMAATDR